MWKDVGIHCLLKADANSSLLYESQKDRNTGGILLNFDFEKLCPGTFKSFIFSWRHRAVFLIPAKAVHDHLEMLNFLNQQTGEHEIKINTLVLMHWHRVVVGGCPHLNMFVPVSYHSKTLLVTLLDSVAFHLFKLNLISSSAKRVLFQPTFPHIVFSWTCGGGSEKCCKKDKGFSTV